NQFPTASYKDFNVTATVQTAPRPLLSSDGEEYGIAPTQTAGTFKSRPSYASSSTRGQCSYVITAAPLSWPATMTASTTATPGNEWGSASPYVGGIHSVGTLIPVHWDSNNPVIITASNIDYQLGNGMAGSQ